jgi:hypothetical protein
VLGVGIPALIAIKKNKNALDFVTDKRFLISIATLSLLLLITSLISLVFKIYFTSILKSRKLKLQYKVENTGEQNNATTTVNFSVNRTNNNELTSKITFNSGNEEGSTSERIPLYKTGLCSKSGSYNFFFFATITSALALSIICIGGLISKTDNKISEFTHNPKMLAYGLLGMVVAVFCAVLVRRFAEPLFDLMKDALTAVVENVWKFVKWLCVDIIAHYATKAWGVITMSDFNEINTTQEIKTNLVT